MTKRRVKRKPLNNAKPHGNGVRIVTMREIANQVIIAMVLALLILMAIAGLLLKKKSEVRGQKTDKIKKMTSTPVYSLSEDSEEEVTSEQMGK